MREKIRQFFSPQRLRFMAVGLIMALCNLGVMLVLVEVLDFNELIVNWCRLVVMTPIRFVVYRRIVWIDERAGLTQFGRYLVHKSGSIVVKQIVYTTLVAFGMAYWVAYLVCILVKGTTNYKALNTFVFRKRP